MKTESSSRLPVPFGEGTTFTRPATAPQRAQIYSAAAASIPVVPRAERKAAGEQSARRPFRGHPRISAGSIPTERHHSSYANGEISLGLISLRPPQNTLV